MTGRQGEGSREGVSSVLSSLGHQLDVPGVKNTPLKWNLFLQKTRQASAVAPFHSSTKIPAKRNPGSWCKDGTVYRCHRSHGHVGWTVANWELPGAPAYRRSLRLSAGGIFHPRLEDSCLSPHAIQVKMNPQFKPHYSILKHWVRDSFLDEFTKYS